MPNRKKSVVYAGAIPLTVVLLLLIAATPQLGPLRFLIALLLAIGWIVAGCRFIIQRYGRMGGAVVSVLGLMVVGTAGIAYWLDRPNRRLVSQIEELPGCYAVTTGRILTGEVYRVYISSKASDKEVWRFTQLEGLDHLESVFLDGVQVSDATAKALGRFTMLRYLTFKGTGVTEEAIEDLMRQLPDCKIEGD